MKLVKQLKAKGKAKLGPGREFRPQLGPRWPRTWGTAVDGEEFQLDGQPPPATSAGWGDMSWTRP